MQCTSSIIYTHTLQRTCNVHTNTFEIEFQQREYCFDQDCTHHLTVHLILNSSKSIPRGRGEYKRRTLLATAISMRLSSAGRLMFIHKRCQRCQGVIQSKWFALIFYHGTHLPNCCRTNQVIADQWPLSNPSSLVSNCRRPGQVTFHPLRWIGDLELEDHKNVASVIFSQIGLTGLTAYKELALSWGREEIMHHHPTTPWVTLLVHAVYCATTSLKLALHIVAFDANAQQVLRVSIGVWRCWDFG